MAGEGKGATFPIRMEDGVTGPAKQAADALAQLRDRITGGQFAIKAMSGDLRNLRGSTDEVKKAKDALKAKIDAEKNAVSQAQLALLKAGGSYADFAKKAKPASDAHDGLKKAMEAQENPLEAVGSMFGRLHGLVTGAIAPTALLAGAILGLVASVVSFTESIVSAALSLGRWIIETADAARSASLLREALTGSAQQGNAMASQVAALARQVPLAKSEIDDLGKSLYKAGLGGQTWVDSLQAIGRTQADVGADTAGKLRSILERGVLPSGKEGRFAVTLQELRELRSNGIDLASSFAKSSKLTVEQATQALIAGRVPLAAGAAALRRAAEEQFGKINAKQMLALPTLAAKFRENLQALVKDVNLEPLLVGLGKIVDFFSVTTADGKALKEILTTIGTALAKLGGAIAPSVVDFMERLMLGAVLFADALLVVALAVKKAFNSEAWKDAQKLSETLSGASIPANILAFALTNADNALGGLVAKFRAVNTISTILGDALSSAVAKLRAIDWIALGREIVNGLITGLASGGSELVAKIQAVARKLKTSFADILGIHSPSAVFAEYGEQTGEGYTQGLYASQPKAHEAARGLVARPGSGGAEGRAGVSNHIRVEFYVASDAAAHALKSDPSFLAKLTKAFEEMNLGAGVPNA